MVNSTFTRRGFGINCDWKRTGGGTKIAEEKKREDKVRDRRVME